jgi:putative transposase
MVDMTLVPEAAWREARRRAEVVRPLAARDRRPRQLVQAAAATLGLSERQTYALWRRCRDADGDLTALLPGQSSGGRNKPRGSPASEAALERIIRELYLTPQKLTAAQVVREVIGRFAAQDLRAPSPNTIRRRLKALSLADRRRRGEEHPQTKPVHGRAPPARQPLDLVQPGTKVGELCAELGVTRQTLYRHVDPKGVLRLDGEKLLGCSKRRASLIPNPAQVGYVRDTPPLKRRAP